MNTYFEPDQEHSVYDDSNCGIPEFFDEGAYIICDDNVQHDSTCNKINSETTINNLKDYDKELYTLEEILSNDLSKVPFLVQGLIPAESISIIVGESDLGKSTLHTQLALSIVSGRETFLGKKIAASFRRVLIVSTEEGITGIGERLEKQCKVIQPDSEATKRLKILISSSDIANKVKNELRKNPVDLVIVDAFSDVYQGDMNISNKVRTFFNAYSEIIRKFHCAVIFITHVGKSREGSPLNKNQVLGSVGIVDKARQVLMMSRDKFSSTNRQLTIIKGNYISDDEKRKSLILNFDPESRTFNYFEEKDMKNPNISQTESIGNEMKQDIYDLLKVGTKREEIADTLGIHRVTLWRFLKKNPPPNNIKENDQKEEWLP